MANPLKALVLKVAKTPPEPPAPFGDEESLLVFRAAPAFFQYNLVLWMIKALATVISVIFAFGFIAVEGEIQDFFNLPGEVRLLLLVLTIGGIVFTFLSLAFSLVKLRLDYELRWYKLTDRSVRIREGVFNVREMTMTFANIQNTSITQGPLQRLLGIADVKLETAGGGGGASEEAAAKQAMFNMHTAYFRGVDNAEQLRDLVRDRMRSIKDAGLGDVDEPEEHATALPAASSGTVSAELLAELRQEASAFRRAAEAVATRA